jgi:hypothetical protein
MGAVLGVGLGVFMGAMGDVSPIQVLHGMYKARVSKIYTEYCFLQDEKFHKPLCGNNSGLRCDQPRQNLVDGQRILES